jgi:hypothetical protein
MAATYTPIASITLGANASSVTFNSIPQTYTDLVLVFGGITTSATTQNIWCTYNSDSSSLYSWTRMVGDGSSASSARATGQTYQIITDTGLTQMNSITHFMNYSNTTTNKTAISRSNSSGFRTSLYVDLYRSTNAISSITLTMSSDNFASGSTFNLYGILGANA